MAFKTIQEAFNHYRTASLEEIERRAADIKGIIETDAAADVAALNIEIRGLQQAKENIQDKQNGATDAQNRAAFNPITGMSFETRASAEATAGDVFASAEYRSAFYKNLLGHSLTAIESAAFKRAGEIMTAEKRADAFGDSSNTAAVLPTQTLNEIISKARKQGGIISVCRQFNLPEKLSVPVATPSANASWHAEGDKVDSEKPAIVNVAFDGYEIIKIFSISAKVRRMSVAAFEQYLVDELTACVMGTIEAALVNGTGSGQGKGLETITWTPGINAVTYTDGVTPKYDDFVAAMALLKRGYAAGACWAMNNKTLYTCVYSVMDTAKRPIFTTDQQREVVGYIVGKPVVIDDNMADGDMYFGNFNFMGYNIVEAPVIEASRESSFNRGLIDYRALAIADTKPIVDEAFVKMYPVTNP